jgi:MinD superfamily P-loop ATPase
MTKLDPAGVLHSADGVTSPVAYTVDDTDTVLISLSMSPEAFNDLDRIAMTTHSSLSDVIAKAFILFREAAEANRQGKAVGIAKSADALETEFVGFEAQHAAQQ